MRALTIHQPWATLIALGFKEYETRGRATSVRGPIVIHAGQALPCRRGKSRRVGDFTVTRDRSGLVLSGSALEHDLQLPLGEIVATAELVDCVETGDWEVTSQEWLLGNWTPGRFAWRLANVVPLEFPVAAQGRQGWWHWEGAA